MVHASFITHRLPGYRALLFIALAAWVFDFFIYIVQPFLTTVHRQGRLLQILVFLQPRLDIVRIPLKPCGFGADGVDALGQRHVKALGALALEERLNVLYVFPVGEA